MIDATANIIDTVVDESAKIYKNAIVRRSNIKGNCIIGDMCHVEDSVLEYYSQVYPMGTMYHSYLGAFSYVQKNSSIWHSKIGKFCSLSWNVSVGGGEHDFHKVTTHSMLYSKAYGFIDEPMYERFSEKCEIGNDVWVASGVSILRGVSIGDGAVIGANAVVTKDVEPYNIVAGVPARKIGQRCADELIGEMLKIKWWDWSEDLIKKNIQLFNKELNENVVNEMWKIKENM